MSLRKFPVLVFIALIALRTVGAAAMPTLAGAAHAGAGGVVCIAGLAAPADHATEATQSCCDEVAPHDGTPSSQHHASSCAGLCAMAAALPTATGLQIPQISIAPVPVVHALSSLLAPPPLEPPRV